jgi:hypothetical protein
MVQFIISPDRRSAFLVRSGMNDMALLTLFLAAAIPIAWFASEFQDRRWLRLTLGSIAILLSFGVAFVVGSLERLNSNAWFGLASKDLIDATVAELKAGRRDEVLRAFEDLQRQYAPTYENRAHYDELVKKAVEQMHATAKKSP